ncbi:MAG: multicopper oxidase domain-containing protein, partial [Chitinophagaceae bacterium]|nr:multicopper oxidase domain-containing protein [Chitinophagaceae bacterium]
MQKLKQKGIFPVQLFFMLIMLLSFAACKNQSSTSVVDKTFSGDGDGLERVKQEMVAPPNLPKFDQVAKGEPKIVEVTLTAIEKKIEVAPGDSMWAFTFNGSVPGPMIVVHQNDFVELTLKNPATNTQMHNIDFHASTG